MNSPIERATRLLRLFFRPVSAVREMLRRNGIREAPLAASVRTRSNPIIAVIGSSTASGHGLGQARVSWVDRYADELRVTHPAVTIRNLAVAGYSSFQLVPTGTRRRLRKPRADAAHNVTAALAERPVALIVNVPSNDAGSGYAVRHTMKNLHAVVNAAREAGVPTWVTTSQPRTLDAVGVARLVAMRRAVLRDFGDHALDFWTPLASPDDMPLPELNQGDGAHSNAEGHRLLFEVVRAADIPARLGL